jgi:hypothetical protein
MEFWMFRQKGGRESTATAKQTEAAPTPNILAIHYYQLSVLLAKKTKDKKGRIVRCNIFTTNLLQL